jgi:dUTP pyrophosphatase
MVRILPGEVVSLGTGVAVACEANEVISICGRSGMAFKDKIWVFNDTIDSNYRDEVRVQLMNVGDKAYWVQPGDCIAQAVVHVINAKPWVHVDVLDATDRGTDGFGASGR